MNLLLNRYSVRHFLPTPVTEEQIERILQAAMQAPSAHNRQPWEFLVLREEAAKKTVSQMSPYGKMAAESSCVIAVLADLNRANPEKQEPEWWIEDCSACTQNILLQTVEEGLGACWIGWYPVSERVKAFSDHFSIPSHLVPFSMIAVGYTDGPKKKKDYFDKTRIHYDVYKDVY